MKIIKHAQRPGGVQRFILDLQPDEKIIVVKDDAHYKLGEPLHEDVMAGHILADAKPVYWCSLEQKWIDQ
jgi:hypothetical protein